MIDPTVNPVTSLGQNDKDLRKMSTQDPTADIKQLVRVQPRLLDAFITASIPRSLAVGGGWNILERDSDAVGLQNIRRLDTTFQDLLIPPDNFAEVAPGIFRSSFPKEENFHFLKTIGLNSIMTLVDGEYTERSQEYIKEHGVRHFRIPMPGNKDSSINIPFEDMIAALRIILDRRNHPLLIHCNKGRHRTGCVVGFIRRIQNWGLPEILGEYRHHANPKSRPIDEQYINTFDETTLIKIALESGIVPNVGFVVRAPKPKDGGFLTHQRRNGSRSIVVGP
ncbi:MAG: hypothetical protein M1837_006052 [Sclerophora amabilis]|nr:MAG: hypothetical protein M1837_006052 [Sclerophora amabilis]